MTDTPTTFRAHRAGGYELIPNETIRAATLPAGKPGKLSCRALGLLVVMLGKPPGWRFSARQLSAELVEGREATRSALQELAEAGYYRVTRVPSSAGFSMVTEVAALPKLMPKAGSRQAPAGVVVVGPGKSSPAPRNPAPGNLAPGEPGSVVTTENHYGEPVEGSSEVELRKGGAR